jgi:hypothetical protein
MTFTSRNLESGFAKKGYLLCFHAGRKVRKTSISISEFVCLYFAETLGNPFLVE